MLLHNKKYYIHPKIMNRKKGYIICEAYQKMLTPSCFFRALKEREIAEGLSINQGH